MTIKPTKFNKNHPELREGEVFFMNKPEEEEVGNLYGIESHRLGNIAYKNTGEKLPENWKPMFVRFK